MSTRQDYLEAIGNLVSGTLPLGEAEKIQAIDAAVLEHSQHKPREVIEDFSGNGGFDYPVSGFASWSDGFSAVKRVEYPVDDTDETPDVLQDSEWMIYEKPAGECLRFLEDKPLSTETFRVKYTAPHTCTDTGCTIKSCDERAVQALAAAHFCRMLATYFAQDQDSTIAADSVDHKSKSRDYEARAKVYRKSYFDFMGVREGEKPAASLTWDWDKKASWQSDKLTHKNKYR